MFSVAMCVMRPQDWFDQGRIFLNSNLNFWGKLGIGQGYLYYTYHLRVLDVEADRKGHIAITLMKVALLSFTRKQVYMKSADAGHARPSSVADTFCGDICH